MILRSSARGIVHESAIAVLLVGTCLVSLAPASAFAQQSELDGLAATLSKAISEAHGKRVIVLDFTTTEGKLAELGHLVSDDFFDALAKNPGGFELIRPMQTKESSLPVQASPLGLLSKDFVKQAGKHADADIVVYGSLFPQEGAILIDVGSLQVDQDKQLAELHGRLPVAPEREPLLKILRNESAPFPPAGRFGFGLPKCVYCPPSELLRRSNQESSRRSCGSASSNNSGRSRDSCESAQKSRIRFRTEGN